MGDYETYFGFVADGLAQTLNGECALPIEIGVKNTLHAYHKEIFL